MELRQSGLQQLNGFTVISLKLQLQDLGYKSIVRRSLPVYFRQELGAFLQVTLSLIDAGLCGHHIRIVRRNIELSIVELERRR